jgi:hypothetical protein
VRKLPSIVTFAAVATLLAGCSTTADDPTADSSPAPPTASSSATPSATPAPGPSTAPSPTQVTVPEETLPQETLQPVPEVPASVAPTPEGPPLGADAPVAMEIAVTPGPEWGSVSISVPQGSSLRIDGSGYKPGQQITLSLGVYQTDGSVMEDQVVHADATGAYSSVITLAPDLEPRTYGLLVYISDGEMGGPEFEASKRSVVIEVVPS